MNTRIRAGELATLLGTVEGPVSVLSLDCFDTLLWRDTAEPIDVFFSVAASPLAREHGITAQVRVSAESRARRTRWVASQSSEVGLAEIYRAALPAAPQAVIDALAENELQHEMRHCHAFGPVVELIGDAVRRGLQVIIVSDTYFSQDQLKRLILNAAPGLEPLIDRYFCSSEHGASKAGGIWSRLLPRLRVPAARIVHVGDNPVADHDTARRLGMHGFQLLQHDDDTQELLRLRQQFAVQLLPELRHTMPLPSPHHAQLGQGGPTDPAEAFGHASLGPVMHGFATFVRDEVQALRQDGATVKLAFLLRDGHLPQLAYEALAGVDADASRLNISRFTAIASSFRSDADVHAYLAANLQGDNLEVLARQLLLSPGTAAGLLAQAQRSPQPATTFARALRQAHVVREVIAASEEFRARLLAHVRSRTGVRPGDTLVFVDLGYSGTAQTRLRDIFRDELGVELLGRYLLSSQVAADRSDRKGLVESTWIDPRAISALTGQYISAFEMLCTLAEPSTVDYTDAGEPVHAGSGVAARQSALVQVIQRGCLRFIREREAIDPGARARPTAQQLAQCAAIDLGRLLYLPTRSELRQLDKFQFDFNLGTDKTMQLFDFEQCVSDMRNEGLPYMNAAVARTSYPMELRHTDVALSSMLFNQNRFGFGMKLKDSSLRTLEVPMLVTRDGMASRLPLVAHATFDGFYQLVFAATDGADVAVLLGESHAWIEAHALQVLDGDKWRHARIGSEVWVDGLEHQAGDLFKVAPQALLYVPAPRDPVQAPKPTFRLVFRPLVAADAAAVAPAQAAA